MDRRERIAVLIPARGGGELLRRVVAAVRAQRGTPADRLLIVDSGSPPAELAALRALGAEVVSIPAAQFDHGATRDLAAGAVDAEILVFLNQDALPVDDLWLDRLTAPLRGADPPAAVQGGIREFPADELARLGRRRFYWDSCGPRFYFTRESERWIARHAGIGFSTVNCAIAGRAWREQPFGRAPILEDKRWQRRAAERGWRIAAVPEAAVWHTHDYDLRSLLRRCASEGFGWRQLGEPYRLGAALADAASGSTWRDGWRGLRRREVRSAAELLFPVLRPLALWWGSRFGRRVLP